MNLHRCRSCGLKLETGDICQRCQDIDTLARDVFRKTLPHSKDQIVLHLASIPLQQWIRESIEAYQDNLIFSGIETDPIELAQFRGASYYPRQWSWEELDPNIENFTPELVADRKSCMEPEYFAAFIDRMAGNVKKAFNIED